MAEKLAKKHCVPCKGGVPPLTADEISPLIAQLNGWSVVDNHHLTKSFEFEDFVEALAFVNRLGEIAEAENHHPDIFLTYGLARIEIFTHKIDGLTESDFVLAAKIDTL